MKLIIFGATGIVGRRLVEQALAQGHQVTAFVRDAAKIGLSHPNVCMVTGDVLDEVSVQRAIQGQNVVLWCPIPS